MNVNYGDDLFESDEEGEEVVQTALPATKKSRLVGGEGSHSKKLNKRSGYSDVSASRAIDDGDEYDSGEEMVRTAEDDAFIDSDDDDHDGILSEYRNDKQDFRDERPLQVKKKKRHRDDRDVEGPVADDNPMSVALSDMKRKRHEAWTDDKKAEIAQEVLLLIDRAAEEDDEMYREGNVPYMKLQALPRVQQLVGIKTLQPTLLEYNLLTALNKWIEPKDRHTLPGLSVRTAVYEMLRQLPCQLHHLKRQPALIGKTVMKLLKSEHEIDSNKAILNDIVEKWNRLIFNKSSDMRSKAPRRVHPSGAEGHPSLKRQGSASSKSSESSSQQHGFEEILSKGKNSSSSGDSSRVRVPFSTGFQFSVQPASRVNLKAARELLRETAGGSKDTLSKKMKDMSSSGKKQQFRAVTASLTGKDRS